MTGKRATTISQCSSGMIAPRECSSSSQVVVSGRLLLSTNLERPPAAARAIAFTLPRPRVARSSWRPSTRPGRSLRSSSCVTSGKSPLRSSGAAPARDQSSRAQRRTRRSLLGDSTGAGAPPWWGRLREASVRAVEHPVVEAGIRRLVGDGPFAETRARPREPIGRALSTQTHDLARRPTVSAGARAVPQRSDASRGFGAPRGEGSASPKYKCRLCRHDDGRRRWMDAEPGVGSLCRCDRRGKM